MIISVSLVVQACRIDRLAGQVSSSEYVSKMKGQSFVGQRGDLQREPCACYQGFAPSSLRLMSSCSISSSCLSSGERDSLAWELGGLGEAWNPFE